jgi:hypothetical protein
MKKFILGAVAIAAIAAIPTSFALSDGSNDALTTVPLTTAAKSTDAAFTVTSDVAPGHPLTGIVVSCTASAEAIKLTSLTLAGNPSNVAGPTFGGCTDNATTTHSVTIKANSTLGKWTSTYADDPAESGAEVRGSGDTISIQSPKKGITTVDAGTPMCELVANNGGADAAAVGAYNDLTGADSINYTGGSFVVIQTPHTTPACPLIGDSGTYSFTGDYHLSPILTDG